MAHKVILYVSERLVSTLMRKEYLIDIHFISQPIFFKAVMLGFDKDAWEKKNGNKVIIENDYKCYQCQSKLLKGEYGKCLSCCDKHTKKMINIKDEYNTIDKTFWGKIKKLLR